MLKQYAVEYTIKQCGEGRIKLVRMQAISKVIMTPEVSEMLGRSGESQLYILIVMSHHCCGAGSKCEDACEVAAEDETMQFKCSVGVTRRIGMARGLFIVSDAEQQPSRKDSVDSRYGVAL